MSDTPDTDSEGGLETEEETNVLAVTKNIQPPVLDDHEEEKKILKFESQKTVINVNKLMEEINTPVYSDVTPMLNSKIPFLIDGDALIMYALLQDNHEIMLGGQFLHVVYFCERFLHALLEKGGNFIIVFFEAWRKVWGNNAYITCLRLSVQKHFKEHSNYSKCIMVFPSFNSADFDRFLHIENPRCVLLDLSYHLSMERLNKRMSLSTKLVVDVRTALLIICAEILFFRVKDLPCIDLCEINIGESLISSYNLTPQRDLIQLTKGFCRKLNNIPPVVNPPISDFTINCDYAGFDARRAIVIIAASKFLSSNKDVNSLKLILLCYASLEVLHLEHRCCPLFKFNDDSFADVQDKIINWMDCILYAFKYFLKHQISLEWNNIADIWQATMFSYICYIVQNEISSGAELGHLKEAYEQYVQYVQTESNEPMDAYPILPETLAQNGELKKTENDKTEKVSLHLLNNTLIKRYCGESFQDAKWRNPPCSSKADEFDEIRHWHCNKPLTDDYDRIKENFQMDITPENLKYMERRKQKQIANYAHYLYIYGCNLEGNSVKSETIISGGKNDETSTRKKERKKVLDMKQKIKNDRDQTILAKENERIKELKSSLGNMKNIENKLSHITMVLKNLTKEESISRVELIKLRVYRDYIKYGLTDKDSIPIIKDIFLVVKKILEENKKIEEEDRIFLSKLLHQLGLDEIARRNNLPTDIRCKKMFDLNWVRFQLQHLGAEMKRLVDGVYDPDVGFIPDPWQAKFISAIRKKQSALVVAPTSSGKTFAAYYCMKRVLQESENGVVVYVAPTKALVNQVEATIYARFKNTNLPAGKAVVGVFTRDYRSNTLNSRILVTVPQCLEILLLSPRRYTWLKNLKYAIFDEVHKLTGSDEGSVWERCLLLIRCPFLALSATISEVPNFHNWLVSNENYKQEQDRLCGKTGKSYEVVLVEHTERHTDLKKYVYDVSTDLQHYHPYYSLNSKTLKEHNGIPSTLHLSPEEVLQLFDVMYSNEALRIRFTEEYNMYNFFSRTSESGFIRRNDVTMYEKILAKIFYEIHEENEAISRDIIKKLSPVMLASKIAKPTDIPTLLNCMAERNLLPCIVFSYNRNLIEYANCLMVKECKNAVTANERKVQAKDDEKSARRKQKEENKRLKIEKKMREKEEGNNDGQATSRSIESSIILKDTGSKFKGVGIADTEDMKWLEKRLVRSNCDPNFVAGLPYGVVYHHAGLNNRQRSTAEILFRMGVVKVVFATGTLALGIHMPCKSVVIFDDSPFLNSIEYHQMSGRAGRRGFDTEGNVIFMGLTKNRRDMLMTERLPKMLGNFPVSVTLVARLLLLVTRVTDNGKSSEGVSNITLSSVLALLENSLIFKFKPDLKNQIKYFVDFAAQLLFIQGIYNAEGVPLKLAGIVNHLHYHEPANLVFAYLFRCGALRQLVLSTKDEKDAEWMMVIVLSHLFARLKLHQIHSRRKFANSKVRLEPLPTIILETIKKYNREVESIFNEYFISVAQHFVDKDDTLPVSGIRMAPLFTYEMKEEPGTISAIIKTACVKRIACSNFVAISGNDDTNLYTGSIISNIKHKVCPGIKVVPLLDTDVVHNSYAADFYRHGIVKAIRDDNGLKAGAEFSRIKDFFLVLKSIVTCLEEMVPVNTDDPVYNVFKRVSISFEEKYNKAFYT